MAASSPKTIAAVFLSRQEKARFPELKLRAMLGEAVLQGGALCTVCSEDCSPERDEIFGEVWADGGWRRERVERIDAAIVFVVPTLARQRMVLDWIRSRRPTIEDVGPDKASLPGCMRDAGLGRYVIPQRELGAARLRETIASWLVEHGSGVIKPADGNRGKGLSFIAPHGDGWALRQDFETVTGDLDGVVERAAAPIAGRLGYRTYMIQKYVRSVASDGRSFHVRVDVHKDGRGEWRLVHATPRVAEVGCFVSNITNGGYEGPLDIALQQRRVRPAADIQEEALALAFSLARALDHRPDTRIKELGVDIGVDERDELWVYEANIQPQASLHHLERARLTMEYSLAVASGALSLSPQPVLA